jgi:DMSO/TMAO reductase YedYZ heme-binding membrane subunit
MSFFVSLMLMAAFAFSLRKPLSRHPVPFYVLAAIVAAVGIYFTYYPSPNAVLRVMAFAIQKGHIGFSLFGIVMFVGIFEKGSRTRNLFAPVRAELSIMAAILIVGHFVPYLGGYLELLGAFSKLPFNTIASLLAAFVMLILLAILTVTSINAIKRKIDMHTWTLIQRWAYVFFGLIYFHLLGYLLPPALSGAVGPQINLAIYSVLFLLYVSFKTRRALLDRKAMPDG